MKLFEIRQRSLRFIQKTYKSKALAREAFSELFDSFIEFSGVLWDAIGHFLGCAESSDQDELFSNTNAGSSLGLE